MSLFDDIKMKLGCDNDRFWRLVEGFPQSVLHIYCEMFSITGSPRLNGFALFSLDHDRLYYLLQAIAETKTSGEDVREVPVPMRFRSPTSLYIEEPTLRFCSISKNLNDIFLQCRGYALDSDGAEYQLVSHYFKFASILSDGRSTSRKHRNEIYARPDMADGYADQNTSMMLERAKRTVYPEDYPKTRTPKMFG